MKYSRLAIFLSFIGMITAGAVYAGTTGTVQLSGGTSGTITVQPQAAAGTYNFNLPTTAGSSGQPLLSAGGGATAMTWGSISGNTTTFATTTGTLTSGHCVSIDASGNLQDAGSACGGGTPGGSSTNVQFNNGGSFAGDSGFTYTSGSGAVVIGTSVTVPLAIGGTGASSTLTLESTSGSGTSDAIIFKTASQSERMRITTGGVASFNNSSPANGIAFEVDTQNNKTGPGTVAVTSGSGTVTGTGTSFLETFQDGDTIQANTETHTVTAVASDTSMTTDNWTASASGQTYTSGNGGQRLLIQQNGSVLIGSNTNVANGSARSLFVSRTFTNYTSGANGIVGITSSPLVSNTSTAFPSTLFGIFSFPQVASTNTQNWTGSIIGVATQVSINASATGIITNAYGHYMQGIFNSGSGTLTNAAGMAIANVSAASNNTQLLLGTTTIPSGNFGIYNSSTSNNYFAGNVGIGTTVPGINGIANTLTVDGGTAARGMIEAASDVADAANNIVGQLGFFATTNTSGKQIAAIMSSTEGATAANRGGVLRFFNKPNGGSVTETMRIDSAGNVGIGSTTPVVSLDLSPRTDAIALPSGTTGQRPGTLINGMLRYNTSGTPTVEAYVNGAWTSLGGGGGGTPGGTSGQIQYNNSSAFGGFTMSGDCTIVTSTGVITCTKTSGTTFGALATLGVGTGLTSSGGNLNLTTPVTVANGGTGAATLASGALLVGAGTGAVTTEAIATAAQFQANTATKVLDTGGVWSASALTTLTDAVTIAVDMSTGINFTVTLGGNRTLGNPTNTKVGQTGVIAVLQPGAGGPFTLNYSSNYKFASGTAPVLSSGVNKLDCLWYFVLDSTHIYITLTPDVR